MIPKVNIKTIAKELNLSPATISRVLNGKAKQFRISTETVELVEKHAAYKGYSPNLLAKGLQASKTFTIGLMIPDIANPFFALMAKSIEKAASSANYSILLVDAEENIEKEKKEVRNMIGRKVDGIIAAPVGTMFEHFQEILNQHIPLVFVDRYNSDNSIAYITSNNYSGAFDAAQLLINNGHTRIALIKGNEAIEPVRERNKGYLEALKKAGIQTDAQLITGNEFSIQNGYQSVKKILKLKNKPTAIFAMSNLIGLGVLQALKEANLSIPNDISLIIFDDQPYVAYLNPPITTVKQDSEKIGELAFECILKKIDNKDFEIQSTMIPAKIIERESVKRL
jgi:LacI family transcriptional regulator